MTDVEGPGPLMPASTQSSSECIEEPESKEVERLLSDKLCEGFILLEAACPTCITPLVKKKSKKPTSSNGSNGIPSSAAPMLVPSQSFDQPFLPVLDVPYCVTCQAHVVTTHADLDNLEACDTLKDKGHILVSLKEEAGWVEDEPDWDQSMVVKQSPKEVKKPAPVEAPPSSSCLSCLSPSSLNQVDDTNTTTMPSPTAVGITLKKELTIPEETEETPQIVERQEGTPVPVEMIEVEEVAEENVAPEEEEKPAEVKETPEETPAEVEVLEDKAEEVPVTDSVPEEKEEDDDVDEVDEVFHEYSVRRAVATKVLGAKMLQGYTLREVQCLKCGMPMMEREGEVDCVVCPALLKKARKIKGAQEKEVQEVSEATSEDSTEAARMLSKAQELVKTLRLERREAELLEEAKLSEGARLEKEARLEGEAKLAEEARLQYEAKLLEEARIAEESRKEEEARLLEETRRLEMIEEQYANGQASFHAVESMRAEQTRLAENARMQEVIRRVEEVKAAEEARMEAELEAKCLADERKAAEEAALIGKLEAEAMEKAKAAEEAISKAKDALEEVSSARRHIIASTIAQAEQEAVAEAEAIISAETEAFTAPPAIPQSASFIERERWETLQAEGRSTMTRRLLQGWTMIPELCNGVKCGNPPLISLGDKVECVVCGGDGSGTDGVYDYLAKQKEEEAEDEVEEAAPMPSEMAAIAARATLASPIPDDEKLVDETLAQQLAAGTDTKTLDELKEEFETKRNTVSKEIGKRMLEGWTLLDMSCPVCVMPLMNDGLGGPETCVLCGPMPEGQLPPPPPPPPPPSQSEEQTRPYPVISLPQRSEEVGVSTTPRSLDGTPESIKRDPPARSFDENGATMNAPEDELEETNGKKQPVAEEKEEQKPLDELQKDQEAKEERFSGEKVVTKDREASEESIERQLTVMDEDHDADDNSVTIQIPADFDMSDEAALKALIVQAKSSSNISAKPAPLEPTDEAGEDPDAPSKEPAPQLAPPSKTEESEKTAVINAVAAKAPPGAVKAGLKMGSRGVPPRPGMTRPPPSPRLTSPKLASPRRAPPRPEDSLSPRGFSTRSLPGTFSPPKKKKSPRKKGNKKGGVVVIGGPQDVDVRSVQSDGIASRAETVASEALDTILSRMDECKAALMNGSKKDIASQIEMADLIEKLATAAVAVRKLEEME